ncbi:MAG: HDIG domain-containing protein [Methanoregula sp.]|nr:HDIG domain-containing protein [Methanoregula sp.]
MPDLTIEKLKKMLREAGCSTKIIDHCLAVTDCACEYAQANSSVDFSLVQTGAMLHDIGRGSTHSIAHAQVGADLLRARGFSEQIARIVECHTGAGLTADECSLLGLVPRDCIPTTTEEKIVCHADNLLAGARRMSIGHSISSSFHLPRRVRKRMYQLATEVELLCK